MSEQKDSHIYYGTASATNPEELYPQALDLDSVDEGEIVDEMLDREELGMLCYAIATANEDDIQSLLRILRMVAEDIRERLAEKAAK